jgi:hypothetical protein
MASSGMIILMGIALFFNIFSIKWKLENERYGDAALDAVVLVLLGWVFGSTLSGLAIATVASGIMSVYLLVSPPKMDWIEDDSGV